LVVEGAVFRLGAVPLAVVLFAGGRLGDALLTGAP
jgi:hypothetical protein